ncbi:MAG: FtsX-like permease family protein, partial [Tunicatimonas sp.]|uniref:ABC transporter permease n=1 Tax=Tunicatimonas sp. TaxID=1940096 RepID=UPI003C7108F7
PSTLCHWLMLKNYIKISLRNFRKNALYATLNIISLAIGFTAFILITIYLHYETSFENFHTQTDRIYRATYQYQSEGEYRVHWARVPADYVNELPNDVPEIETLIRFQNHEQKYLRVEDKKFRPEHAYVTDPEVFQVFDFPLIAGDAKTALVQPRSVVLTETLARQYFGSSNVLDRELYVSGSLDAEELLYKVTGVMADPPTNTHLPVEMLLSYRDQDERAGWAYVYTLLHEGSDVANIQAQITDFVNKYEPENIASQVIFVFQPLSEIHLQSNLAREIVPNGNQLYVTIFFFVGIFILLVALINYVNLSSALAMGRSQEVGIRIVMGANQRHIMSHAWVESVGYTLVAMVLAGLLAYGLSPYFRQLTGADFLIPIGWFTLVLVAIAVVSGLLAGLYPAIILRSFRALEAIKYSKVFMLSGRQGKFSVKRAMVAVQFGVSVLLVASALVAYDQFQYIQEKNLGMKTEQILAITEVPNSVTKRYSAFRDRVAPLAGVQQVAACMQVPSSEIRDAGPVLVKGVNDDPEQAPIMDMQVVSPGFTELMDIDLLAGEDRFNQIPLSAFSEQEEGESMAEWIFKRPARYLINETAMRQLGWSSPEEALGQNISWAVGDLRYAYGPVTGVVKDFHQETLKNEVDPTVMVYEPLWLNTFLVKVETAGLPQTLENIHAIWNDLFPTYPMDYHFLDDLFERLYTQERVQLHLLSTFSGLAIVIAFLGLFSLVAYALKTRTRELAIRRVLGANFGSLIRLISQEYAWLLLTGGIIALPLSYLSISRWLEGFAYRIDISVLWYLLTISFIGLLLLATIGWQMRRSTSANPATVLRDE